jgi:hypothetical protein
MRGLEEIKEINENPAEHYKRSPDYSGAPDFDHRSAAQKFHGERVEARQAERDGPRTLADRSRSNDKAGLDIQQPPFIEFWMHMCAKAKAEGRDEPRYAEARLAFFGGPAPKGALTFVDGGAGEGLRAVPVAPDTYRGEYREVTNKGTVWHHVTNANGDVISYASAEAALNGAHYIREKEIAKKFR